MQGVIINGIVKSEDALKFELKLHNARIATLQTDIARLQEAQTSWQLPDTDFTGLQSENSYTLRLCHTPCDSYEIRSSQEYLTWYNDNIRQACYSELDAQTQRLQTLITSKEQELATAQALAGSLTYQLHILQNSQGGTP